MKGNKVLRAFCGIFKVLIIIVLIAMSVYLAVTIWDTDMQNNFVAKVGNYGVNPDWLPDGKSNDIDLLYDKIATDGEFAVAYAIYRKACEKLMLVQQYGVRAVSSIDVDAIGVQMEVASNRTEQYRVAGTPMLNANQKVFSSYTNTIYVIDVNNEFLGGLLKPTIQFADRGYSDGANAYKQKGKLSVMEGDNEVIEWAKDYGPEEQTAARTYEDGDIKEKCNFIFTPETILKDSVIIEREYDEKYDAFKYRIRLSLDCSDNSEGSATYYEAKAIGDVLGKNMKSLVYNKLDIDMTMYSNGYLLSWDTVQEWTLTYSIPIVGSLSGTALNTKKEVLSYDARDCEVVDFTK